MRSARYGPTVPNSAGRGCSGAPPPPGARLCRMEGPDIPRIGGHLAFRSLQRLAAQELIPPDQVANGAARVGHLAPTGYLGLPRGITADNQKEIATRKDGRGNLMLTSALLPAAGAPHRAA